MKAIFLSCWTVGAMVLCGCSYGDLSVYYKECSQAHPCPDDFLCVERPVSLTEMGGHCHTPADAPPCPAPFFCNPDENWVEACRPDGFSSTIEEDCDDSGLQCNPDTGLCTSSCTTEQDCAPGTCDTGTGLCRPFPDCRESGCASGQFCVGGASCVPKPEEDADIEGGGAYLECETPPLEPGPAECTLTGRVYFFPLLNAEGTPGLTVILRPAGDPETSIDQTTVAADPDGNGQYRFEQVSTDRAYDLEIVANADLETVTTIHAGLVIRADRALDGSFSRALSAMRESDFLKYSSSDVFPGLDMTNRSLVVGRVTDCNSIGSKALANVTAALAVPPVDPGGVYYFLDNETALVPDTGGELSATTYKGYFAAAGVPACRNLVGFAALDGSSTFSLGFVSFVAKPGSAVIANLPVPADRLPE